MAKLNIKKFKQTNVYDELIVKIKEHQSAQTTEESIRALNYIGGVVDTINSLYEGKDYHYLNDDLFIGIQNSLDKSDFIYLKWK